MKKIFFAAVFAGALLGFTSCGNREMVTDPEMYPAGEYHWPGGFDHYFVYDHP